MVKATIHSGREPTAAASEAEDGDVAATAASSSKRGKSKSHQQAIYKEICLKSPRAANLDFVQKETDANGRVPRRAKTSQAKAGDDNGAGDVMRFFKAK